MKRLYTVETISSVILFIFGLIALLISLKQIAKKKSPKYMIAIPLYFAFINLQLLAGIYDRIIIGGYVNGKYSLINLSAIVFIVIEYYILAFLLSRFIKSSFFKKYLFYSSIGFTLLATFCWPALNSWTTALSIISTTGSILLILPSLYYFYEIMKNPPILQLNKEPAFWIVTGILFLFVWILPLYLSLRLVLSVPFLRLIDYFAYTIVMILFTKATSCSLKTTIL